ncbi:unnamed protein product [Brassicogethes aeneus]|uniref:DRBM domain-containing protein n=1 Tax=Brassicogethes aeneus TaxID=1431903 RepID=A0A9P0BE06_BRAAE|nr:unnamed protein product [Brassicogethes aeneus]
MDIFTIFALFCLSFATNNGLSIQEIKNKFKNNPCIPAYIASSGDSIDIIDDSYIEEKPYHSIGEVLFDKQAQTKLAQLHELAVFNGLKYKYTLIKEEGPAHKKEFTILLKLGEDEYEGTGKSLKAAQKEAASKALQNSVFKHPAPKNINDLTPTVLLNNIANQLGLEVKYEFINPFINQVTQTTEVKPKKSYIQKMNDTLDDQHIKMAKSIDQHHKGPFTVVVTLGNEEFIGTAHTKQEAKHKAATTALESIKINNMHEESPCFKDENGPECKKAKETVKNPISRIYEAAQKNNLVVSFNIVEESGAAHKKEFTTECKLGDFVTFGKGGSKKASKKNAAENMVINLPNLVMNEEINNVGSVNNNNLEKTKKKKNKKNKVNKEENNNINKNEDGTFLNNIIGSIFGNNDQNEVSSNDNIDNDNENSVDKKNKKNTNVKSMQTTLLELANSKQFEVNYLDLTSKNEKDEKSYTLLSMAINPTVLCFGEGINPKSSREVVSMLGLKMLNTLGILDVYMENLVVLQNDPSDVPGESISVILSPDPVKKM